MVAGKPAVSAEIELVDAYHARCHAVLSGIIVDGDAERIRTILPGASETGFYVSVSPTLCLNSPGGSFAEGLEIARYLRETGVRTHVAAFDECLSACAIAFLGGTEKGFEDGLVTDQERSIHAMARLGFHGPSLRVDDGSFSRAVVEEAFEVAIQATAQIFSRLEELRLSNDFALNFIDVPQNAFLEINTPERVQALGVGVVGLAPLPQQLSNERLEQICYHFAPIMAPDVKAPKFQAWGKSGETAIIDLPSEETVLRAYLVAVEGEGTPYWLGCVVEWDADSGFGSTPSLTARVAGMWSLMSDRDSYDQSTYTFTRVPPSSGELRDQLDDGNRVFSWKTSVSPSFLAGPTTSLASIASPSSIVPRSICGADQRSYSVRDVTSFATMRAAPGFDKPVIAEVPLDAQVTPVLDDSDSTHILSDQCLSACTLSRLPALTPEALNRIDQCRRSSNEVWWQVSTEKGQAGWMSSKFLADFRNGPF